MQLQLTKSQPKSRWLNTLVAKDRPEGLNHGSRHRLAELSCAFLRLEDLRNERHNVFIVISAHKPLLGPYGRASVDHDRTLSSGESPRKPRCPRMTFGFVVLHRLRPLHRCPCSESAVGLEAR